MRRYPDLVRHETTLGLELLCRPATPPPAIQSNRGGSLFLLGEIFERGTGQSAPSARADLSEVDGSVASMAEFLIGSHWGSYLAFLRCPETGALSVLRDPSGAIPAETISDGALGVVADQIPRWLHEAVAGPPEIAWEFVAAQLHDPSTACHRSFLKAVKRTAAGSLVPLAGRDAPRQLWRPATMVGQRTPEDARLAAHLRYTVRDAVAALTGGHERALLELSGGLDSAILLSCLSERNHSGPPTCINMATRQAAGDERVYARAAADRHRATLIEILLNASEMDYRQLADQSDLSEPRLYGADATHEHLVSEVADSVQASAIVTGQGGDAVFFQEPTPLVAADHLQARGLGRETWPTVVDSADRSHRSVWAVLAAARDARRRHRYATAIEHDNLLLGPAARGEVAMPRHPWLEGIERLPPAKRVQLQILAGCQFFRGPTARGDRGRLIHPLLAQPVVELCLAIPSWKLAHGRHDRALARSAFASDLPEIIARRRGKGEVSTYYSHAILANLAFLRALLLDGQLVRRGLLDAGMLEIALSEASLVQRPDHRVLVAYATLEAWLQSWC
jgi:asparagine synthase (glutamine-hydrolysing)